MDLRGDGGSDFTDSGGTVTCWVSEERWVGGEAMRVGRFRTLAQHSNLGKAPTRRQKLATMSQCDEPISDDSVTGAEVPGCTWVPRGGGGGDREGEQGKKAGRSSAPMQ